MPLVVFDAFFGCGGNAIAFARLPPSAVSLNAKGRGTHYFWRTRAGSYLTWKGVGRGGGRACARRGVRAGTTLAAMKIVRCCCRGAGKKGDVVSWKECLFG